MLKDYDAGWSYSSSHGFWSRMGVSRIFFEILIKRALDEGLIRLNPIEDFILTPIGKKYAIDNGLVNMG